jgi:hypothetical protein
MQLIFWNTFFLWCWCIGATVGANGGFTLAPGLAVPDYKADEAKYQDGGMAPLYNFARKFINMCLSDIEDVIKGDVSSISYFMLLIL